MKKQKDAKERKTRVRRTLVEIEVLSREDWNWDELNQLANDIVFGDCSGRERDRCTRLLSDKEAALLLSRQHSNPSSLLGEDWKDYKPPAPLEAVEDPCPMCGASGRLEPQVDLVWYGRYNDADVSLREFEENGTPEDQPVRVWCQACETCVPISAGLASELRTEAADW